MNVLVCKICGASFQPISAIHYIAREREERAFLDLSAGYREPKLYDAYHCPLCGSQVIAGERLPMLTPDISEEREEED